MVPDNPDKSPINESVSKMLFFTYFRNCMQYLKRYLLSLFYG
ncbi:Uncharacterised protein [Bifidobacterium catenulatum]|nr:Uncharacterised protein [Bifidobacterium catenulatum]